MLCVKALMLVAGSGTIAGVTYSQIQTEPSKKTVVVSNNHESKIRSILEKNMNVELLTKKEKYLNTKKTHYETNLKTKQQEFNEAEQKVKKSHEDLNKAKENLNDISKKLTDKYKELETKNNAFKDALVKKMEHELTENEKELKKTFYEFQKNTYETEKSAIQAKIKNIDSSFTTDACSNPPTWSLTAVTLPKTQEETDIEKSIQDEVKLVCDGLTSVQTNIANNNANNSTSDAFTTTETERKNYITEISNLTSQYNSQIIEIMTQENNVKSKMLSWQNKQSALTTAKKTLQQTINKSEVLKEEIKEQQSV